MNIEDLTPKVQNAFSTYCSLEEIQKGFEGIKKKIGGGRISGHEFLLTRVHRKSPTYRIFGKLERSGSGYRIVYQIRLLKIIELIYGLAIPVNLALFFVMEPFTIVLHLVGAPFPIRLLAHMLVVFASFFLAYKLIKADMDQSEKLLKEAFAAETAEGWLRK